MLCLAVVVAALQVATCQAFLWPCSSSSSSRPSPALVPSLLLPQQPAQQQSLPPWQAEAPDGRRRCRVVAWGK